MNPREILDTLGRGVGALLLLLVACPLEAQSRFLLEGLVDGGLYITDDDSRLVSLNQGDLAVEGQLQLWSAFQLTETLQIYALGEFESNNFSGSTESEAELEQLAFRYTRIDSPYIVVEAGKILSPITVYSDRHLSTYNPLIGQLFTLPTSYPIGAQLSGSNKAFDYRAGLVDLPDFNPDLIDIDSDSAYRPVFGLGVTPVFGFRLGASYTKGPYLGNQLDPFLPAGSNWRDFDQRVVGFDFQFGRGYLELNGEWLNTEYEVPYRQQNLKEDTYFLELSYAWTPRFYGAVRLQGIDGAFLRTTPEGEWITENADLTDLEIGCGYWINPNLLLKFSYRHDDWRNGNGSTPGGPEGYWVAAQLSWQFDPRSWVARD